MRTNRRLRTVWLVSLLALGLWLLGVAMDSEDKNRTNWDGSPDSNLAVGSSNTGEDFILFAPLSGTTAYLIDRDGDVVHDWTLSGQPGNSVYLLEGGDLLATYTVDGVFQAGGVGGGVELLDWNGTRVWSFELATEQAHLHHDVEILPNGNVLLIAWERKTRRQALAAGLSPQQLPASGEVWSEMILEVDPSTNSVVWEWHLWDHVLPAGEDAIAHPGKVDLAFAADPDSSDWFHINAVDYHENLDQILLSVRHTSEIWILDHGLTSTEAASDAGDLLYRYGNPEAYGASGIQILLHQHDAKWLDGNSSGVSSSSFGTSSSMRILLFDNGDQRLRPYSRVVEIELPDYVSSPSDIVLPAQIVWAYGAASGDEHFYSNHISGAQRLGSGNTLVCVGAEGRFFEVTTSGEIVWEYVNPFTGIGPGGGASNEVFRAVAYSAAFVGQDL